METHKKLPNSFANTIFMKMLTTALATVNKAALTELRFFAQAG